MKIWLIIAAVLVALGLIAFTVVMFINHWDFSKLSTVKYVTTTHQVSEAFTDIVVNTKTADVLFGVSDDDTCKVVCKEQERLNHSICVVDGALTVNIVDQRKWYEYIGISVGHSQVTVYLPQGEYGSLTVKASTANVALPRELGFENVEISLSTGDISSFASISQTGKFQTSTGRIWVEGITPEALELSVTTGRITVSDAACRGDMAVHVTTGDALLTNVTCRNLCSTGSTGNISLTNVVASDTFSLKRSTGDICFTKCDATEIAAQTSTGKITGSLLSEKVFITQTDTGHVEVPKSTTGGRCEVTTDTGDIKFEIVTQ